jgi:hypothetical protein
LFAESVAGRRFAASGGAAAKRRVSGTADFCKQKFRIPPSPLFERSRLASLSLAFFGATRSKSEWAEKASFLARGRLRRARAFLFAESVAGRRFAASPSQRHSVIPVAP